MANVLAYGLHCRWEQSAALAALCLVTPGCSIQIPVSCSLPIQNPNDFLLCPHYFAAAVPPHLPAFCDREPVAVIQPVLVVLLLGGVSSAAAH